MHLCNFLYSNSLPSYVFDGKIPCKILHFLLDNISHSLNLPLIILHDIQTAFNERKEKPKHTATFVITL